MENKISILTELQSKVYIPAGFDFSQLEIENESQEYGACSFKLDRYFCKFRVAKTTPTKTGQFVTFWKRKGSGPIQPYDSSDRFDFLIVSTQSGNHFGQFVFPKDVLVQEGVVSTPDSEGKRAIRVYPPWDHSLNRQAQKTQSWQIQYFLKFDGPIDLKQVRKAFSFV